MRSRLIVHLGRRPCLLDDGAGCAAADGVVAGILVEGEVVGGGGDGSTSSSSVIGDGGAVGDDGTRYSATHSILAFIEVDGAVLATGSGIGDGIVNGGGGGCVESGGRGCAGGVTTAADGDGTRCSAADRIVAGVTVDGDSASGGVGGLGGGVFIHAATCRRGDA